MRFFFFFFFFFLLAVSLPELLFSSFFRLLPPFRLLQFYVEKNVFWSRKWRHPATYHPPPPSVYGSAILTIVAITAQHNVISTNHPNRSKLCGNCAFPQNFHTRKLAEITVFYAVHFLLCSLKTF